MIMDYLPLIVAALLMLVVLAFACCIVHPFCFSCALFPSELLERSSKRSAPLARSCPVLLSFFASSLAVASRKPSAARSPAFDDFRSSSICCSFRVKTLIQEYFLVHPSSALTISNQIARTLFPVPL